MLQTVHASITTRPALAIRVPLSGGAGPGTCLFTKRSLPSRHSSLLSRTPSRVCGSLRQQASGTSSLSRVSRRKTDANRKSSGPLTPQQPNYEESEGKSLGVWSWAPGEEVDRRPLPRPP